MEGTSWREAPSILCCDAVPCWCFYGCVVDAVAMADLELLNTTHREAVHSAVWRGYYFFLFLAFFLVVFFDDFAALRFLAMNSTSFLYKNVHDRFRLSKEFFRAAPCSIQFFRLTRSLWVRPSGVTSISRSRKFVP